MNPADQWLAINAKYFPAEQVQYIRQRIEALPEAQVQLLYTLSFPRPNHDVGYLTFSVDILELTALS